MYSSSSRIQALLKGFLLDKIQQVDHSFQNIVTDYIKRSSTFQSFKDGRGRIIRADGLDFYPLSRAVRIISGKRRGRVFVITATEDYARSLCSDLSDLDDIPVVMLPSDGKQLYSSYSASPSEYEQKNALDAISDMKDGIVVVSLRAFVSPLLSPQSLERYSLRLKPGDPFDPQSIGSQLADAGYFRSPSCYEEGSFSIRGEVMDIFPFSSTGSIPSTLKRLMISSL